ncbi:MAG: tetratricopeptide repeat protein, partial [Planctomycetota bacterium]
MIAKILVTFALLASEPAAEAPSQEPPAARAPVELEGKSPQELVAEGSRYFADGDYDGAISRWGRAQRDRPNSPEVDLNLGLAHLRKGEHDRAADYFIAAASKGAGRLTSKASFNLGNARVRQGRFEDAVEAYEDALRGDPGSDDARHNHALVLAHIERLKELEKRRKDAEDEFKKRLEALMKEIRELVEAQAGAVRASWATDPKSEGALPVEDDAKKLKELASEGKPLPDDLAAKLARALVKGRGKDVKATSARELAKTEREISKRARGAAKTAAFLASDLKRASGAPPKGAQPQPPPGQPSKQADKPPENPLIGKLERAGGALVEGASKVEGAARKLDAGSVKAAEPAEALGLWKFVKALGELASPPEQKGGMSEELKKILKRMAELRKRQAELVLDVWASAPASRGRLPDADEQKAFWAKVRAAEALTEAERVPLARL